MNATIRLPEPRHCELPAAVRSERDSLRTRVRILEAALACIGREADTPMSRPELSYIAVHRIASVARQTLERVDLPPGSVRRPIVRTRL